MNGRSYENTLTHLSGKLEDGVTYMTAGGLIQEVVLSTTSGDVILVAAYHVVDGICIYTGCIYNSLGFDGLAIGFDEVMISFAGDLLNSRI